MADSIEWTHADAGFLLYKGDEDAGDGNCPDDEMETEGNYGLRMGNCCLYGQPGELLELLGRMKSEIISTMIDDGRYEPASAEPEPEIEFAEVGKEVPF